MQDYYPLSQGNSWTYFEYEMEFEDSETEIDTQTETEIVSGTDDVGGVSTIRLIEEDLCCSQEYYYKNIAWNEKGLMLYYEYESDKPEGGGTQSDIEEGRFLTPAVLLPAQMEIGQTVSHDFAIEWYEDGELEEYEEGTSIFTLEDVETITVEAGTFENCLRVHAQFSGIVYDRKGGTKRESWTDSDYVWLAPGIGTVKEICIWTVFNADWTVDELGVERTELRWGTIDGVTIGTGVQYWNGFDFSNARASFNETTMYLRCVRVGDVVYHGSLAFRLDFLEDNIFYAFEPEGYGPVSISGLDFTNAYIKMNGDSLTIYDIDISGTKYWTQWRLVSEPSVGFLLVGYGLMQ
jgi:hypothetical protein